MGYIISKTKELKTYVRSFRGGSVEIVTSDKIGQGKRIKIGDVIIIGIKQPETTSNTVDIKNRC